MNAVEMLSRLLPGDVAQAVYGMGEELTELRLRAGRPAQLVSAAGDVFAGDPIAPRTLNRLLAAMMDYSLHAYEQELAQGYFTLCDGSRVGVCGRMVRDGERLRMTAVGALCVRIGRQARGCADALLPGLTVDGRVRSTLILSPPGEGKTTLLRELTRRLSEAGWRVCVSDERRELAACREGVPTLDVGPRTDVMDGLPKAEAIPLLIRAMSPQVIVADEIGAPGDALALADAVRCGVTVLASAHAVSLEEAMRRPCLSACLGTGIFPLVVVLEGSPGRSWTIHETRTEGGIGYGAVPAGAVRRRRVRHVRAGAVRGGAAKGDAAQRTAVGGAPAAHLHDGHV